jgi:phosphate-selective porin
MRVRGIGLGLAVLVLGAAGSLSLAQAQAAGAGMPEGLPLPPAVEKELAAKAIDMTEVTLGKNMLDFAAKFMKDKDEDDAKARKLIQGLKGIYVRDYTFEKEGDYSMDQIKQLRAYFETSDWSPIVRSVERKKGETTETTDVLVKTVNGQTQGMFILSAEPKELSIVLILGPINVDDLSELHGIGGLHVLKDVEKSTKKATKDKDKDKNGGAE